MPPRVSFSIARTSIGKKYARPGNEVKKLATGKGKNVSVLTSEWIENFIHIKNVDSGAVERMDLAERKYLRRLYDTPAEKTLFMTSRQTEKCDHVDSLVSLGDGRLIRAGDVRVGDVLASMSPRGRMTVAPVEWVSKIRQKACLEIETRQGHILRVATTHPVRTWEAWTPAASLRVGDRIAAVRQCGEFAGESRAPAERIRLTAYLIGDGDIGGRVIGFTQVPGPVLQEFCTDVWALGGTYRTYERGKTRQIRLRQLPVLENWLREDGLRGNLSAEKSVPAWVFGLTAADTALFLNRLWATDGHVSQRTPSNYLIAYASMSLRLVEQVQALLWKFRIPSRIRKNWPSIYKKRGEHKYSYIVTVETKDGVSRFLTDIGALGKSEAVPLPERESNNNLDTLPQEVQNLITRIVGDRRGTWRTLLHGSGLKRTLAYPPTYERILRMVEVFRADGRFDDALIDELEQHATSDLYWDRVKSIRVMGEQPCVDFEIKGTHNFVTSGVITHNSTTLGNRFLALLGTRKNYPALFVTPSAMQTMVFSRARLDDIIDISPVIKALNGVSNLLEKRFRNGSVGYLRYAFLNADRIRGISALALFADEIQDLLPEVMPVIEEVTSHHAEPKIIYSGTPKSYDNTIEKYWQLSTQSEWGVPCEHHGTPRDPSSWYWNVLGERNIGKTGPICAHPKCGKPISATHPLAQWVQAAPGAQFEGLRICRLMVPWYVNNPKRWKDLLEQRERYSDAKFKNEVLAQSFDGGDKPLTRAEVIRACDDKYINEIEEALKHRDTASLFAGIDWGPGSEVSYTLMSIGGYVRNDNSFQVLLSIRFEGPLAEPDAQLREILRIVSLFRIRIVGVDHGFGFVQNKQLTAALGPARVVQYQYQHKLSAKLVFKAGTHRYLVFRTPIMSDIIYGIKTKKIRLPRFSSYEKPFADDFLSIRAEYSNTLRMTQYTKPNNATDDTFHSVLFLVLASFRMYPRPDIIAPVMDGINQQSRDAAAEEAALKYIQSISTDDDY